MFGCIYNCISTFRFVVENSLFQMQRKAIQGFMYVWLPTWSEREKVKRLSSRYLVRNLYSCFYRLWTLVLFSGIYCTNSMWPFCIFSTSAICAFRASGICATPREPGGSSWRECRVQMSGPWWPTTCSAMEKGGCRYPPWKVKNLISVYIFCVSVNLLMWWKWW